MASAPETQELIDTRPEADGAEDTESTGDEEFIVVIAVDRSEHSQRALECGFVIQGSVVVCMFYICFYMFYIVFCILFKYI